MSTATDIIKYFIDEQWVSAEYLFDHFGRGFNINKQTDLTTFVIKTRHVTIPTMLLSQLKCPQYELTEAAFLQLPQCKSKYAMLYNVRYVSDIYGLLWNKYGTHIIMTRLFSDSLTCYRAHLQLMVTIMYADLVALGMSLSDIQDIEDTLTVKPWIVKHNTYFDSILQPTMDQLEIQRVPEFGEPSVEFAPQCGILILDHDMLLIWIYIIKCANGLEWIMTDTTIPTQIKTATKTLLYHIKACNAATSQITAT